MLLKLIVVHAVQSNLIKHTEKKKHSIRKLMWKQAVFVEKNPIQSAEENKIDGSFCSFANLNIKQKMTFTGF